ncbi:Hypothetical protein KVN_LOCUS314 [uncultured virus]|nr:Hypothetical protein KVN_LOCUS314 [uncultured virus]
MEKFNIGIIQPNQIDLQIFKRNDLSIQNIIDVINNFVTLKETSWEYMMDDVTEIIHLDTELLGDTILVFENENYIYQFCHLNPELNGKIGLENDANYLSSFINIDKTKLFGPTVLICSQITQNFTCVPCTIDINTIAKIIYSKIIHKGIFIKTNGTIEEFKYLNDPMEIIGSSDISNYQWMQFSILKFNIVLFVQVEPINDEINKKITKFNGQHFIHGDAIIVLKSSENDFIDIDHELFLKILDICEGPLTNRNLTEEELNDDQKNNNLPIIKNQFCILNSRLKSFKYCCHYCNKEVKKEESIICSGCLRFRYHNQTCQKQHWVQHKSECLFKKPILNCFLKKKK